VKGLPFGLSPPLGEFFRFFRPRGRVCFPAPSCHVTPAMSMNLFRAVADILHLLSFFILIVKIRRSKNVVGLSLKMQELYMVVFVARYLDLLWNFRSLYLTVMKTVFIGATAYAIYLIRVKYWATYDRSVDSFKIIPILVLPCLLLSFVFTHEYGIVEILWTFSILLEAVALLPQVVVLRHSGEIENITADYVFTVGIYRALYILNWVYRYFTEDGYIHWLAVICGLIQTAMYIDFFYEYARSKYYKRPLELPT
jgi:ER lumen protein retaining receptor